MAYPCRQDGPGTLHHVGNRTVDGWFCFRTERHHRVFMYAWACMVRRGWVRIRSYVLMGNHYHVALKCLNGDLGETVRQVENAFTHYSNTRRRRKGDSSAAGVRTGSTRSSGGGPTGNPRLVMTAASTP